ncbi:3-methyl-2-oxobutanoate hydroxymethyltransferase [Lamprobacter modestohalophilus]|uniref:3-methyl-2-oxobutanoate hydroxymethyltransferase n=1 Tax=Lamprobacter modestohalophilus TaxID=1064514 RepID=A0A9X0W731_9GAMM|nr:3-methyl-2-oxobutanoate hydroxymethyltransferase [Lamprobacter modestohalophilus]MBK1618222.1 3-methyl-2-oxobutanoate hydroxymethyltransferase [Lamprobacter modestohalophilus]
MSARTITTTSLRALKQRGERIACLTCYDAAFARVLERSGVEVLLVGDSLGMVIQGQPTTVPVTLDQMVYHSRCVTRAAERSLVIADMPFMSYATPERAVAAAARLMGEGGAAMVKLEGGEPLVETVARLTAFGAPVCAHLGLLPQSVHQLGGYRVQGREAADAERIETEALALQDAGASLLILECVPSALAAALAQRLRIPVIGIGAGNRCDGQVLVLHDVLGLTPGAAPRFSKNFLAELASVAVAGSASVDASDGSGVAFGIEAAIKGYVEAVKSGAFPAPEHTLA